MYKNTKIYDNKNGDYMKIEDIMSKSLITCEIDNTIHQISKKMKLYDIGFIPITEHHNIVGIITDRDIVVEMISNYDHDIKNYIKKDIISINKNQSIDYALDLMGQNKIKRLLVTNKKRVVGILSLSDILSHSSDSNQLLETIKKIYAIEKNTDEYEPEVDEFYL